ncbi:MAG: cupin domain-containing protein [Synergistaceae bacterium]|jgi:mannose-6-phosphate isomerase-like protein (cupin superfamily)|nr:cupin domain-containing protein [Synergistaceae bacterium]
MSETNWGRIADIGTLDASALAPDITKRNIFGPGSFWDDYVMRHFIVPEGSEVPMHAHEWDHLTLSLGGHGEVEVDGEHYDLENGNWARVPGGTEHSFRNIGHGDFTFICIVPVRGDPHAKKISMRAIRKKKKEEKEAESAK